MNDFREWYQKTKGELTQGGLWLRGGELNTLPVDAYEERPVRALFVRLSTYLDTGYSFTHQFLYQLAFNTEGVFPDLAYLPPKGDLPIFARDGVPWLLGTQSKRGPRGFDVIGFSNSIVQELINVPHFLKNSGIPVSKAERMADPTLPLVILGGANALYSSCLWLDDPMVDGVFVGESDQSIRRLLEIVRDGKAKGLPKKMILECLTTEIPGFFEPENPRPSRKNFVMDLNRAEALTKGPVYFLEEPMGSAHLQISEGCPCFCSFCAEAWERKPYRERSAKRLLELALEAKMNMGLDTIEIYSFNFNMHSELYQLLWDLVPYFHNIGLKSQRFDLLAHDPEMLKFQQMLNKTSLTCGLEGISPRLQKYLSKNLEEDELHASLEAIFKNKTRELKVFLIATGREEEQDFVALTDLLEHLRDLKKESGAQTRLIFSMTPLVRFPWTPLEFEDGYSMEHYDSIIRKAAGRVRSAGFEFRESADLPEYWVSQVLVRTADARTSRALRKAIESTGFVYYREITDSFQRTLQAKLDAEYAGSGILAGDLIKGFDLETSRTKPWATIQTGVKREFLWERVEIARQYAEEDYCLGRSWTKAKCFHCGACPTRFHVRDIVLSKQTKPHTFEQFKIRRVASIQSEMPVAFQLEVSDKALGLPRKMVGVALARALMRAHRPFVSGYRRYHDAHWGVQDKPVWMTGSDRIELFWHQGGLAELAQFFARPENAALVLAESDGWFESVQLAPQAWRPSLLTVDAPSRPALDRYLLGRGLKFTLRKDSQTGDYCYDLTPQAVKKGVIVGVREKILPAGEGSRCELTLGPKFNLSEFAEEAYLSPRRLNWNQLSMRAR